MKDYKKCHLPTQENYSQIYHCFLLDLDDLFMLLHAYILKDESQLLKDYMYLNVNTQLICLENIS